MVTLDGQPLAGAEVMFVPREGGRPATGTSDEQGKFQLTTIVNNDGALLGAHGVAITKVKHIRDEADPVPTAHQTIDLNANLRSQIEWLLPEMGLRG